MKESGDEQVDIEGMSYYKCIILNMYYNKITSSVTPN